MQLVHFDLKSSNVLLQDKEFSAAKIADLGISRYVVKDIAGDFCTHHGRGMLLCNSSLWLPDMVQTCRGMYGIIE